MSETSPDLAPAEQADHLFQFGDSDRRWYVLHSKPRCEKKAAKICLDGDIHHYLPLRQNRHRRRKGQRRYSFNMPLLPGYLFACCDTGERLKLLRSGYLVQTIDVVDQSQLLEELRQIYLASAGPTELTIYPQLKRGRRIRVVHGPLSGIQGRISARKEAFRLVLNVSILGTAVAAEVDMDDVELL